MKCKDCDKSLPLDPWGRCEKCRAERKRRERDDPKLKYVFPDVLQGSQSDTPDPPPIDFAWLAAELRKVRKAQQARLVEFMADKEMATVEDVAEAVHDFGGTDEGTIWANVNRTNKSLAALGSALSFRMGASRVFREISPGVDAE
jgi:hypothetical protein